MFNRITQGLKTTSNDLAAAQDYRCRESSILNRPDITSALPKRAVEKFDKEEPNFARHNNETKQRDKEQTAYDEAFAIICRLQSEQE